MKSTRAATTLVFFLTGAIFASWAARIPAVQERLDLSPGELALAVLGIEGGAVAGLSLGAVLSARLGSRNSLRIGFPVYGAGMLAVALAPGLGWLAAALALTTIAVSVNDVAMNAQGVELERRARRPVLSRLHAGHGFGVLAGAGLGAAAAGAGIGVPAHFAVVAVAGPLAGLAATTWLVDEPREPGRARPSLPRGRLAPLAAIAFFAFLVDGSAINWSAVHLTGLGAGPALAAAAFAGFALAVAVARLAGDHALEQFGRRATVRAGGMIGLAAAACLVAAGTPALALAGWVLLGAAVAVIAPAVLGAAPGATDVPAAVAIGAVTTVGYLGSFSGPPAIGALAELVGLGTALALVAAACLAIAVLAARISG